MPVNTVKLGKRIKAARKEKKLTQEALAARANIAKSYLQRIETGRRTPSLDVLLILADTLNASLDVLLEDSRTAGCDPTLRRILSDCTPEQTEFLKSLLLFLKPHLK